MLLQTAEKRCGGNAKEDINGKLQYTIETNVNVVRNAQDAMLLKAKMIWDQLIQL